MNGADMNSSQGRASKSVDLIAHGDSQVTHGEVADIGGVGTSPAFVSRTAKFAIAPQFVATEPFSHSPAVRTDGVKMRLDDYLSDSERRQYRSDVEILTRAQQLGDQAVGRRLFRRRSSRDPSA